MEMKEDRHNYEYDVDVTSQTAPAKVVRFVGDNKNVLEIGCGPGSITKVLAQKNQCEVFGFEYDESAIAIVKEYCVDVVQGDLNKEDWPLSLPKNKKFDAVVAADVLEHIYNPESVLNQMRSFIDKSGFIVLSLPHVGHSAIHACLLDEDFQANDWGLLDRTHIKFFGIKNIQNLVNQAKLKIVQAEYVLTPPEKTEFANVWESLSGPLKAELSKNPFGNVYQVVVKLALKEAEGEAIDLLQLRPSVSVAPAIPFKQKVKNLIRPYLSDSLKAAIRRLLGS